jgi:1,2-diacylglycerol 3-alpha-glucosyltransferase
VNPRMPRKNSHHSHEVRIIRIAFMNIAIFTNNYLPNPYGVSTSIETFRKEFEKKGHTVYVFAPKFKGYTDKNSNVFRYLAIDIDIKFRFPLPIPYSRKMDKIIKDLNIDIIHAQHPNLLGTAAKKWAKNKKVPLIFTGHTLYDQYTDFVPFLSAKFSAGCMIKKAVKFANNADAVVVPTDSIIPILKNWGVEKEMIPVATGVSEEEFENPDRNLIRKKYNINKDDIVLLSTARLTAEKNMEFVFRAVKEILTERKDAKFLVVGGGYLMSTLQKYCSENGISNQVIFSDAVENGELKNYYAAADIFVHGSKSETQGMILTEAMYMGLPVVAVCATGVTSLIQNNKNGFLTCVTEEKEFAYMITKLILDKNLRKKTGEESARIARENFTASVCAEKMLEVYKKAIESYKKVKV